ncbi:MAG: type II secretion system major pseudopilin GspG [Verrucomicrobiota bacterium]
MTLQTTAKGSFNRRHFSFIELMVVMMIIGFLAAIILPNFMGRMEKSKVTAAKAQISSLTQAVQDYLLDNDNYPPNLEALIENTSGSDKWDGPYLEKEELPVDPWGNEYQYRTTDDAIGFEIISYGKDGSPGGEGLNADISSREN